MEILKELFEFNSLNLLSLDKGRVLISDPFINDDYFSKSVVFLCEVNEKGGFGLVLNHYIPDTLGDFMNRFENIDCSKFKISIGGPVDTDSIYYMHTRPDLIPDSIQVNESIFLGNGQKFNEIGDLIENELITHKEIRFFLGYSGWTPGQLQDELIRNSWFVGNIADSTLMTYQEEDIWKKTLEKMSDKHRVISNFPINPLLN
ncbi:MAG: YqgE/AlgH family protein [Flavobacteriales bacterium]